MYWPDTQTGVDVEPARKPVASAVRKFFTEGGLGQAPTVPGGDWFNQITNELLNVLAAAGIDPSKVDDNQLLQAIQGIASDAESYLRQELAAESGASLIGISADRTQADKNAEMVSVTDKGAIGDGVTNCKSAFVNAEAEADLIYVPIGTFFVDDFIGTKFFFGPGKIKISSGHVYDAPKSPQVLDFTYPNTVLGLGAIEIGSFNTFLGMNVGHNAGPSATTNVLIGHNLASGDTIDPASNAPFTGYDNVGIGFHALKVAQTAHSNVAIGRDSQNQNKTGNHNITIGVAAGQQLIDIDDNICIGGSAGSRLDAGVGLNTYMGRSAGKENKDGARNTCLGWGSGMGVPAPVANHTGDGVTTTFSAGTIPLTNVKQIRVDVDGINVLPANYSVSGTNVIFNVAPLAGAAIVLTYTIGSASYNWNTFVGTRTGFVIKSGSNNTFLGASAGENTSIGSNNVNIGYQAGQSNDANGCIFIGNLAGRANVGPDNQLIVANQASLPFLQGTMGPVGDINNVLRCDGSVTPATDNVRASGSGSRRWSVIFAGNGTINTSDAREKTAPLAITDAVLDAWADVQLVTFQWLEAIAQKGEDVARWHFGVIAQQVRDAFLAHGIDGQRYGLLCYDEWDDEYSQIQINAGETVTKTRVVMRPAFITDTHEVLVRQEQPDGSFVMVAKLEEYQRPKLEILPVFNADGSPRVNASGVRVMSCEQVIEAVVEEYEAPADPVYETVLDIAAGNRWGIRADQCLFLEAALQRRNYERLLKRVEAL